MRLPSALAGAALALLTGLLARDFGGGRFAMGLAAASSALAFVYVVVHYVFTMNAYEPLFWTGCAFLVVRIARTGDQRLWLWFGLVAGLGLQNKYSMGVYAFGLVVGVLLTPERRALRQPWIWLGGVLAGLVFLPNVIWNVQHGWPFFELMRNLRASGRDVVLSAVAYVLRQAFNMNPANLPLWTAAGGWRLWLRGALVALLVAVSLVFLPMGLPILSPEALIAYQERLGLTLPTSEKAHARAALPHHFAWQFGWKEMVAAVAATYRALPPEEQARVAVIGNNYGEADAVDLLGPTYGLPMKALGTHQSYWLWGPGDPGKDVLIVLGDRPEGLKRWCADVQVAAKLKHPWGAAWENGPVLVCRQPRLPILKIWPKLKHWS